MKHSLVRALPLLLLSSCLVTRPEVPKPECEVDSECAAGKICGPGGRCSDACKADADCAAPRTCQAGACTLPTGTCARDTDCATGELCSLGNRCAKACVTAAECAATEACVAGACTSLASGACRFNSECPAPQACVSGRCAESCMGDRDCPFGTTCQGNLCTPPAPGCLDATDCMAMQACSPQGDCVASCTTVAQCAATGEACSNGACVRVGADTAGLSGSVVLTGVTGASGLAVSVEGPNRASGVTAMDGTFTFQGLLPGLYRVTVSAAGTVEGSATREAAARANATTPVPPFTLTPAGDVTGTVTLAGRTSHEGIQVVALGTGQGTVTAPDGSFTLRQLPVGSYDLLVAYTGYQAAQLTQVAVTYAMSTATSPLTLQPVPSGSTFAFSSLPPSSTPIDRPFTYQAVAGGGGVSAVTYALVDGPSGMTMNPNTGQVAWQPTSLATVWVVLSATGAGATVYQLFYLSVDAAATEVYSGDIDRLIPVDGGVWLLGNATLTFLANDGGTTAVAPVTALTGNVTSVEHLNGRTVTGYSFSGGTISDVRGPVGTLNGTWEGGVVGSIAGVDVRTVQSVALLGGTSGTATVTTGDTISAVTWPAGPITSIDDGRSTATGFRANTGILGTVTSTGFDDPTASWTPDAFNALCVLNAAGTARIGITSHTATTFILDSNPSSTFAVGERYFIGSCSGTFTTTYTFVDANRTATPAASGRQIDIYAQGVWVGNFALTATTPPPNSTLSFTANISQFNALQNAAATGFYTVALNSGLEVIVTDSSAPWTTTTHSTSNFLYDDYAQAFDIVASTTTTLTVRQGFGTLVRDRTGRGWVLADTGNNVQVTVTLANGGLPNVVGQYLWMDPRGEGFYIASNTANTATLDVYFNRFPLQGLVGGLVGRSSYSYYLPGLTVPTAGLTAGAHVGRYAVRLTNGSTPFNVDSEQQILSNTSSSFNVDETYCSSCVDGLAERMVDYSNVTWAPGQYSPRKVDFRVALSGSPNFPPESLRGRFVVLESNRAATGTILHNDASSLVVEVDETWFAAFRGLTSGDRLWLSDTGSSNTSPLRVKLTGQGAGWTINEWVGASVIAPNNQVAGVVTGNTATELDLTVTNTSAFLALSAGANFAFARAHTQGLGCSTPGVWIRTNFTLPGATLVAGAYTHVRSEFTTSSTGRLALFSNTTTGATAYVCGNVFSTLISMVGRAAVFDTNGRFNLTVDDSTATLTPNALVGQYLYLNGTNGGRFGLPISTNTATSYTVNAIDSYNWFFSGFPWRAALPGTRYSLTDIDSEATVVATVTPALAPGALDGRWVHANDSISNSTSFGADFLVGTNTANTVTLLDVPATTLDKLRNTGTAMLSHLSLSRGTVVRVTDSGASLTPGALVGRIIRLSSNSLLITDNTATTITARSNVLDAFGNLSAATTWSLDTTYWRDELTVRPNGNAVALRTDGRVADVSPDGTGTWVTPFTGALALNVRTSPLVSGVLANAATSSGYSTTWTDSAWSFAPDALVNSYMRMRDCSSVPSNFLIRANTATSVSSYATMGCSNIAAGWRYAIDPARLLVTGTTLTAGALRGARLWINGYEYLVRDNTTNEVQLIYPEDYRSGPHLDVVESGGTAYVLRGPTPTVISQIAAADGAQGLWVGASTVASRYDGTAWTRIDGTTTGTRLRTGTVSFASSNNVIVDTAGGMTTGEYAGKRLVMLGQVFTINTNTPNSLTISSGWTLVIPVPGTPYEVYDTDGFGTLQTALVVGANSWLGTTSGLYRLNGSTWTAFTSESTESAPGAGDGLLSDDVERLVSVANGDLFALSTYSGASRLRGTTWSNYTVANTESALNLGDGLPDDDVYDVTVDGAGTQWFSTGSGAARLMGTTWSVYGPEQGLDYYTTGVWLSPSAQVHVANQDGLFVVMP
ncbi:MAG: carboxypeptidase-like regulatory domain-containing protein [Archangium sp.]|nr:carboxypeptidase-like regulatory domain-containing protein [Archangium sp.]